MKYEKLCNQIIENVGGKENITDVFHCVSRLRLTLLDESKLSIEKLEKVEGVVKVNKFKDQIQVIIGSHVGEVYDEFITLVNPSKEESDEETNEKKQSVFGKITGAVSGIMMPLTVAMIGFGLLKGFCMLFQFIGILDKASPTYTFFYNVGDTVITFIPVIVAYSASKYFKTNTILSIMLACVLFNSKVSALVAVEGGAKLFGFLTLGNVSYSSTVVPPLLMVWFQKYVEIGLNKVIPSIVRKTFAPLLTVIITIVAMYTIIGPVGAFIGEGITAIYTTVYNVCPPVAGAIIGGLWSLLVSWGMHTTLVPIVMNNLAVLGYDTLMAFASCGNFGQLGGLFATFFNTKNKETKENSASLIISSLSSGLGLTEPVIYGNNLVLKVPFYAGLIGGAVGGLVCSLLDVRAINIGAFTVYKFALYAGSLTGIIVSVLTSFAVSFILTCIKGVDKKEGTI